MISSWRQNIRPIKICYQKLVCAKEKKREKPKRRHVFPWFLTLISFHWRFRNGFSLTDKKKFHYIKFLNIKLKCEVNFKFSVKMKYFALNEPQKSGQRFAKCFNHSNVLNTAFGFISTRCSIGTEKTRKIHIGSHFIRNIGTHIADYLCAILCFFFFRMFCSAYNGVHKFHFLCMHNNVNRVYERCEKFTFSLQPNEISVAIMKWRNEQRAMR